MIHYPEMPARIMRSLSIIHFSEGSSNWIMRQRNIGIIHYPEGIMNNRNNGYFGALFIIHFSTRKTNPPPPPPHTHTHTPPPKTNSTPLFGIPHPRSVSNITIRIRSVLSVSCPHPNSPADPPQQSVHARPEGFSSQSAPAWSPVSRPSQPAADRPRRPELRACYAFHLLLLLRRLPLAPHLSCIMNNDYNDRWV